MMEDPNQNSEMGLPLNAKEAQQSFLQNSTVSEETKEIIIKQIDELKYADKRDEALMTLS